MVDGSVEDIQFEPVTEDEASQGAEFTPEEKPEIKPIISEADEPGAEEHGSPAERQEPVAGNTEEPKTLSEEDKAALLAATNDQLGMTVEEAKSIIEKHNSQETAVQELQKKFEPFKDLVDDPLTLKFAELYSKGITLEDFAKIQLSDPQKLSPGQLVKMKLLHDYPSLTEQQVAARLETNFLAGVSQETLTEMIQNGEITQKDIDFKQGELAIAADESRKWLESMKAEQLKSPVDRKLEQQQSQAAQNQARAAEQFQSGVLQAVEGLGSIDLKSDGKNSFQYAVESDAVRESASALVGQAQGVIGVDQSKVDLPTLIKAIHIAQNLDKISTAMANDISSRIAKEKDDFYNNRKHPSAGSPSPTPSDSKYDNALDRSINEQLGSVFRD